MNAARGTLTTAVAASLGMLVTPAVHATGWLSSSAYIDRIQVTNTGNVVVYLVSDNSCPNDVNHRLEYSTAQSAHAKMVYAGLLAAQAQNRPMNFYVTSCQGEVGTFTHIEG